MYEIKSYYRICEAKKILENNTWENNGYWDLYNPYVTDVEKECYTEEEANYLWHKLGYYVTDFDGWYDTNNVPYVSVKMNALYKDGKLIRKSTGSLLYQDLILWFPEFEEC